MRTLRLLGIAMALALLLGGSYYAYQRYLAPLPKEPRSSPASEVGLSPTSVSAKGVVLPIRKAQLAFKLGGRVEKIAVKEGEQVTIGQVVATLEARELQHQVERARAALGTAQASLGRVLAPAREEELAMAEAELAAARGHLAQVKAGAREKEIAIAQAKVQEAQANLARLKRGPREGEVMAAQAALSTAEANLARVVAGPKGSEIRAAKARVEKAEAAVRQAQAAYDRLSWRADIGLLPESLRLEAATQDLAFTRAEYEGLLAGATDEEVSIAQAQVREARARLEDLLAGPTQEEVERAQAQLAQAQANLENLLAGPTAEEVAIAQAQVWQAEARLTLLKAGASQEEIGIYRAQVQEARQALALAEAQLAEAKLLAPFAGVVSAVPVDEGAVVAAGTAVVILGDLSRLKVETEDLSEMSIAPVKVGQEVRITVDALPGREFHGRVSSIAPLYTIRHGDTTYTVTIDLEAGTESGLRWGMTAYVDIKVE